MVPLIGLLSILTLLGLVFIFVSIRCFGSYYCSKLRGAVFATFGGIFLILSLGLGFWYFSIPSLENTEKILKVENYVDPSTLEGKTIFIMLPQNFKNNPQRAEIIRTALCSAIKEKFKLQEFYCKFYTHELNEALKLNLNCNPLNICTGWVIEKIFTENGREVFKEQRIGKVVFRF